MNTQIKNIADDFVRALNALPEVIAYNTALENYENDVEVMQLSNKYSLLAQNFQQKQYEGTLTEEEISELRHVAADLQDNHLHIELSDRQRDLIKVLQECDNEISYAAGMDFAKLAAPSGCC